MRRINARPSFTDLTLPDLGGKRPTEFFARCKQLISFQTLADSVADVFVEDNPLGGAPHWSVVMSIKILFVQKCFNLSDPMTER